jgi:hypothetical protein
MEMEIMKTEQDDCPEMARAALRAWRHGAPPAAAADAMRLAAWLEGRLDEASAADVERLLAADPTLLEAVLAGRNAAADAAMPREIEAARALVEPPWWRRLFSETDEPKGRWRSALAAMVLVASVGAGAFELGEAFAAMSAMQQSAAMRSMLSNDLLDTLGEK